ncbi:hypothetical protein ACFWBX_24660 [Streptomyces sp. NPDC059991]|uniref:hypothetical protein n=1 Tax=Streptomyces sp. NPDC059991 TaxID=3347028 RepID=UPI00367FA922
MESRAAASRLRAAGLLAQHADHREIQAWTYETEAWRALTAGDYVRAFSSNVCSISRNFRM